MLRDAVALLLILSFGLGPTSTAAQYASSGSSVIAPSDTSSVIVSSDSTTGTAGLSSGSSSLSTLISSTLTSATRTTVISTSISTSTSISPQATSRSSASSAISSALESAVAPLSVSTTVILGSSTPGTTNEPVAASLEPSSFVTSSSSSISSSSVSSPLSSVYSSASSTTSKAVMASSSSSSSSTYERQRKTIIALAVVLGVALIALLVCAGLFLRRRLSKRLQITKTGNPVLDEEIETWRASKGAPEGTLLTGGDQRSSTSQREWPDEKILTRPVTAKAPNARSGLTDSTVPGEDPFVKVRRNSSKLQKRPISRPNSLLAHQRSQSSFSEREKFRLSAERPKTSDRPTTPRQPVLENLAEKEVPPLPAEAERSIRDRASGSISSKRVSNGSHGKTASK